MNKSKIKQFVSDGHVRAQWLLSGAVGTIEGPVPMVPTTCLICDKPAGKVPSTGGFCKLCPDCNKERAARGTEVTVTP